MLGRTKTKVLQPEVPRPLAELEVKLEGTGEWSGELVHACRDARRVDSLWIESAGGCARRIAVSASKFAWARCFRAVTKARSDASCSFHQPGWPETVAQTQISLTGV